MAQGKFGRFELPRIGGGGDLVLRVLSAREVDAVLELDDVPGTDLLAELVVESIHSLAGELWPKGTIGVAKFRALPNKRREFVKDAYDHLHNLSKPELRHLRRSIQYIGGEASFAEPVTKGQQVVDGARFTMRELQAGQVDDALRLALDGRSPVVITNQLTIDSLVKVDILPVYEDVADEGGVVHQKLVGQTPGTDVPRDEAGLKWLGDMSNRRRTIFSAAYTFIHDTTTKETSTFLDGCEALDAPPKSV